MIQILAFLFSLVVVHDDAERLRDSAPYYLTIDTAREHIGAARLAALTYNVDPAVLLSIAHHESRYQRGEVTRESRGKVSCGVMTPEPTHAKGVCMSATSSLAAGYLAGAKHLRGWLDACRGNVYCALTGYAGGFYLIRYCRVRQHRNCGVAGVFLGRAARIR